MQADHRGDEPGLEGGDAVCWLAEVCEQCGALNERRDGSCWRCGRAALGDRPSGDGATMRA